MAMAGRKKFSIGGTTHNAIPSIVEAQRTEMKRQLSEQTARLEMRTEAKSFLLSEFSEYLRKRADVELQYAKDLERLGDKLERNLAKEAQVKYFPSVTGFIHQMSAQTKLLSQQRTAYTEMIQADLAVRLELMARDAKFINNRMKSVIQEMHDDYLKQIKDLHESAREFSQVCDTFHKSHEKHQKAKQSRDKNPNKKGVASREETLYNAVIESRNKKMKSKVDLELSIADVNSTSGCYFNEAIHQIIEVLDLDFHEGLVRVATAQHQLEAWLHRTAGLSAEKTLHSSHSISFADDEKEFLFHNSDPFKPALHFANETGPQEELMASVGDIPNYQDLYRKSVENLRLSNVTIEEEKKTLQFMDTKNLSEERHVFLPEPAPLPDGANPFLSDIPGQGPQGDSWRQLNEAKKDQFMDYYFQKLRAFLMHKDLNSRLIERVRILETTLENSGASLQLAKVPTSEIPELFKGDIQNYIQVTGYKIPPIITNCVDAVLNYGLELEGLFRIPGPAGIIDEYKMEFEAGLNPLINTSDTLDLYAVAGVLKSYLRDLKIPLFPYDEYDNFLSCCRIGEIDSRVDAIKECVLKLPREILRVMAYLFSFLAKVAAHSYANKMNSVNLATVFGPTMSRAPPGTNYLQQQMDIVFQNILIQTCIEHHLNIFSLPSPSLPHNATNNNSNQKKSREEGFSPDSSPQHTLGENPGHIITPAAETSVVDEQTVGEFLPNNENVESLDTPGDQRNSGSSAEPAETHSSEGEEYSGSGSEIDLESLRSARAIYNFTARNDKELSVRKGDILKVISLTPDSNWWEGVHGDQTGFIPSTYVVLLDSDAPQEPADPSQSAELPSPADELQLDSPTGPSEGARGQNPVPSDPQSLPISFPQQSIGASPHQTKFLMGEMEGANPTKAPPPVRPRPSLRDKKEKGSLGRNPPSPKHHSNLLGEHAQLVELRRLEKMGRQTSDS